MPNRILIIDDDVELCELLTEYLGAEGFSVDTVHSPEPGIEQALRDQPALIVLDVMLPGLSGFEVLRRIRAASPIPVLMLTARGDDVDRIVGLEMGADDYLPKPFNARELIARIRAIQRRAEPKPLEKEKPAAAERLTIGDIELDRGAQTVKQHGQPVGLTAVEFSLLDELLRMAGQLVTREELAKKVLGRRLSPYDRSLDVHVSSLRRKLGHQAGERERIRTVRGSGYLYTTGE